MVSHIRYIIIVNLLGENLTQCVVTLRKDTTRLWTIGRTRDIIILIGMVSAILINIFLCRDTQLTSGIPSVLQRVVLIPLQRVIEVEGQCISRVVSNVIGGTEYEVEVNPFLLLRVIDRRNQRRVITVADLMFRGIILHRRILSRQQDTT